jgi:hypothetical protein
MTIPTPDNDGFVPVRGPGCSFELDKAIGNDMTLGGVSLRQRAAPYFALGRFVVTPWNRWTNTNGVAEVFTITQLGAKIPAKLIFTIDGNETTLSFGGPTTTQTLTVQDGETVEGLTMACYF